MSLDQGWEYQWVQLKQAWQEDANQWRPVSDRLNELGSSGWDVVGIFETSLGREQPGPGEWEDRIRERQRREGLAFGWALLKRPRLRGWKA